MFVWVIVSLIADTVIIRHCRISASGNMKIFLGVKPGQNNEMQHNLAKARLLISTALSGPRLPIRKFVNYTQQD